VQIDGDKVKLKKANGKVIAVSLSKLSQADREYVDEIQRQQSAIRFGPFAMGTPHRELREFLSRNYDEFRLDLTDKQMEELRQNNRELIDENAQLDANVNSRSTDDKPGAYVGDGKDQIPYFHGPGFGVTLENLHFGFKDGKLNQIVLEVDLRYLKKAGALYKRGALPGLTHLDREDSDLTYHKVVKFLRDRYGKDQGQIVTDGLSIRIEDTGWREDVPQGVFGDEVDERVITITYTVAASDG
jgi:hypothetical protein